MGQQQLLLIILGVIIVGIAIAVGITLFQDNSVSLNRDALSNDLVHLAARAQWYFRQPAPMGGGGGSFVGLTADAAGLAKLVTTTFSNNDNATYSISSAGTTSQVVFTAVGKAALTDGSFPTYTCTVTSSGVTIAKVN